MVALAITTLAWVFVKLIQAREVDYSVGYEVDYGGGYEVDYGGSVYEVDYGGNYEVDYGGGYESPQTERRKQYGTGDIQQAFRTRSCVLRIFFITVAVRYLLGSCWLAVG